MASSLFRSVGIPVLALAAGGLAGFSGAIENKPDHIRLMIVQDTNEIYVSPQKGDVIRWFIKTPDGSVIRPTTAKLKVHFGKNSPCQDANGTGTVDDIVKCTVNDRVGTAYYICADLSDAAHPKVICDPGIDPNSTTDNGFLAKLEEFKQDLKETLWSIFSSHSYINTEKESESILHRGAGGEPIAHLTPTVSQETTGSVSSMMTVGATTDAVKNLKVVCDGSGKTTVVVPSYPNDVPADGIEVANGSILKWTSLPYGYDLTFTAIDPAGATPLHVCADNQTLASNGYTTCKLDIKSTLPATVTYNVTTTNHSDTEEQACGTAASGPLKFKVK